LFVSLVVNYNVFLAILETSSRLIRISNDFLSRVRSMDGWRPRV